MKQGQLKKETAQSVVLGAHRTLLMNNGNQYSRHTGQLVMSLINDTLYVFMWKTANRKVVSKAGDYHRQFQKRNTSPLDLKNTSMQDFFLNDMERKNVDHSLKNKTYGWYVGKINRRKHTPSKKTSAADIADVKQNMKSFPTMDSHYTRKDSNKKSTARS